MENLPSSSTRKDLSFDDAGVVCGLKMCNSNEAKWLGIPNVYEKFHRPNHYDVGGTYIDNVPDYWISFKTERVENIFLLHIFSYRRDESSYQVAISGCNEIYVDKKSNSVHLSLLLKDYVIESSKSNKTGSFDYITTFSFTNFDVELFKDRNFFIPIKFPKYEVLGINPLNEMRANHHYGKLYNNPIGSDFTIESCDGEKFNVHKIILSTYSDVFKAMFKEDTAESQNSYVKLVDVNKDDLKYMLEFIYTGTISCMENTDFSKLLVLADLYNIKCLWTLAQNALAQQLNKSNALYSLAIAHMYDAVFLKNATFQFIKANVDIIKTDSFKEIKDVELMRELCEYLACTE